MGKKEEIAADFITAMDVRFLFCDRFSVLLFVDTKSTFVADRQSRMAESRRGGDGDERSLVTIARHAHYQGDSA